MKGILNCCPDCAHYKPVQLCKAPKIALLVELVHGAFIEGTTIECALVRSQDSMCGVDGKWWEDRHGERG